MRKAVALLILMLLLAGCGEEIPEPESGAAYAESEISEEASEEPEVIQPVLIEPDLKKDPLSDGADEPAKEIEPASSVPDLSWTVTQYGRDDARQIMFYTIECSDGRLAVIDGGLEENAPDAREVLNGRHVDAWIITHPHPDHVGALNVLLGFPEENDPSVDVYYTTQVNADRYRETAEPVDEIDSFEKFAVHCVNLGNKVRYLKEGDELDLIGLSMKVFHAWDAHVDEQDRDLCNDGSLVFRLSGEEDSFLFTGDVQKEMEPYLIPVYGDELKSTYVQLGHHGNHGLSLEFYDFIDPEAAFADAPTWLIDDTESGFDGYLLRDHLLEHGVTLYRFTTTPNRVVLH